MSPEFRFVPVAVVAVIIAAWLLWRYLRGPATPGLLRAPSPGTEVEARPKFPSEGLLVSAEVLRVGGSDSAAIWNALKTAAVPVAVEYRPVSEAELTKYRTLPVNATVQQSLVEIVKAFNPNNPMLFRVLLPQGQELVKAAGTSGLYRGFAHNGVSISAQALLKPVAVGGAVAAGWPLFAVAGTVMVMDMAAQREQRAHQHKLETILGRQEERYYKRRIGAQRTADKQLSRAINLMLDGREPHLDLPLQRAYDEFHDAQEFFNQNKDVVGHLKETGGKVDYRRLDEALGSKTKDVDYFVRELHLARAAIAIYRKALIADAASEALADPANPYSALRRFFEEQVRELEETEATADDLTTWLGQIELKGRWHDSLKDRVQASDKSVASRQERLRAQVAVPGANNDPELVYVMTASGELLQVIPFDEDHPDRDGARTSSA